MRALVTGVTGQDGFYLAEQLSAAGHGVWGLTRRPRVASAIPLVFGDLLDFESLEHALQVSRPDVVYNLAAATSPGAGWGVPVPPLLAETTGLGVLRLLDAMCRVTPHARLVHASSSAIYDLDRYGVYGIAKRFAHEAVAGYRSQIHASNAVFYSHTSPRQDPQFLIRRICSTLARIAKGSGERLGLGDVDSHRDWGWAPDYMRALPLIAAADVPGDFVIATGVTHSVREVTQAALKQIGLSWDEAVHVDPDHPQVPDEFAPDADRLAATRSLGWKPTADLAEIVAALMKGG